MRHLRRVEAIVKPLTLEDLGQQAPTLARALSNLGTYQDHLTAMSELNMLLRRRTPESPPSPKPVSHVVTVGSFVNYWDPKKGPQRGHVLEVRADDRVKLRVHRTATPDYDVDDVPFSEPIKPGTWGRTKSPGA